MRGLRATGCGCLIILLIWLFNDVVWGGHRLAFRDVAHFYGPLSRFVHAEWAAGRVPLWDPYTGIGVPLAASPTASAFYPAQLIAALPLAPGHLQLAYVMLHLVLAFATCYALARELGTSITAALLAALAYTFSGSVLFQYCNVVFLVGAAWLPAALWAARRLIHRQTLKYAALLGAVLALMTLGGDPQMAYHTGLIIAGYAIFQSFNKSPTAKPHSFRNRFALLAAAVTIAGVLCAVQWIPAVELTRLSSRGMPEYPRNLYQLVGSQFSTESNVFTADNPEESDGKYAALLGSTTTGDAHQQRTYRFSVGPWHLAEFVFPNFSGELFPTNQRWIQAIPAEGRTWVASLYMGLLPALLALACWGVGADRQTRCLRWFTLFCLLAASGHYALGWIAREVVNLVGVDPQRVVVGDAFGGVYWMLVNALPGYETFRYPGKWLVPASLGVALLAAKGWDRRDVAFWKRAARLAKCLLPTSLILCLSAAITYALCPACLPTIPVDRVFGPPDIDGVWRGLLLSLLHAGIAAGCVLWIATTIVNASSRDATPTDVLTKTPSQESRTARLGLVVLLLTSVDLMVAQKPLIGTAPEASWQSTSPLVEEINLQAKASKSQADIPPRIRRDQNQRPQAWSDQVAPNRLAEVVRWDRAELSPLYHLDDRINVLRVPGTMQLADFKAFLSIADRSDQHLALPPGACLDTLSIDFWQPSHANLPILDELSDIDSFELVRPHCPRAWIAHDWEICPADDVHNYRELKRLTNATLKAKGMPRDLRTHPVVETSTSLKPPPPALSQQQLQEETCRITHYDPQRVDLEVQLQAESLVVLADQFYPGWVATVHTVGSEQPQPAEILRVNRVLRGVWLPQGEHRIQFFYRPKSFSIGAAISGLGWLLLLVVTGTILIRRSRSSASTRPN